MEEQNQKQEIVIEKKKFSLNKKLLLIGAVALILVSTLIAVLFITLSQQKNQTATPKKDSQKLSEKKLPTISLSPSSITIRAGQSEYSTNVMVNSKDITAEGVAIEIEYDSSAISQVRIVPSSDADLSIGGAIKIETSNTNPALGRASLVIRKDPSQKLSPRIISGRVAMIYFTVASKAILPTSIALTSASEFITLDASPTNPEKINLIIQPASTLAPDAQKRLQEQSKL